jgi:hypothetical protein
LRSLDWGSAVSHSVLNKPLLDCPGISVVTRVAILIGVFGVHVHCYCLSAHGAGSRSVIAAIGVALVVSAMSFFARLGIVYEVELAQVPRLEPTSQLISGSGPAVSGVMHPWGDGDVRVDRRRIVLCDLIETTRFEPYDCMVTGVSAMTDGQGQFQMGAVALFYHSHA